MNLRDFRPSFERPGLFAKQTIIIGYITITCLVSQALAAQQEPTYQLTITADFSNPISGRCIPINVTVKQPKDLLRRLSWNKRANMHNLQADGQLTANHNQSKWQWTLPEKGGQLNYCLDIDHMRGQSYDARLTNDWAWLRADDLFPPAKATAIGMATAETQLHLKLPPEWTAVTPYQRIDKKKFLYAINNPERRFDRPTGWLLLGKLGIRRDVIDETKITVAAPLNQNARRLDLISLLGFTFPTMKEWLPNFPERLLIVLLSDKTWRGGLSAPNSLYLHAERAYISENSTSPLLHELVHVGLGKSATVDWINEGLAEYLSLVFLKQTGGITSKRFENALAWQANWAKNNAGSLKNEHSSGADTAYAVGVFAALHQEMGPIHFKEFIEQISQHPERISPKSLKYIATTIYKKPLASLSAL